MSDFYSVSICYFDSSNLLLRKKISVLVKKQAGLKSYITECMNKPHKLDVDDLKSPFKTRKTTILGYLQKVQRLDDRIIEIYDQGDESVEERKLSEITSQLEYNNSVRDELTLIEKQVDISPPVVICDSRDKNATPQFLVCRNYSNIYFLILYFNNAVCCVATDL